MANATIDNAPVSIQLALDQSTTVPSDEVWKVTVTFYGTNTTTKDEQVYLSINGQRVFGFAGPIDQAPFVSPSAEIVLDGNDTIKLEHFRAQDQGAAIQGFVVKS